MKPVQTSEQKEAFICGQEGAWCFNRKVTVLLIKNHRYFKLRNESWQRLLSLTWYKVPTVPAKINRFWAPSRAPQN